MMTADKRMTSSVPGGGMPQATDKIKLLSTLEDHLSEAVDGAFLSALLHHALDDLSATTSHCTGNDTAEALNSEAEATTVPSVSAFSSANARDIRDPGRTSRTCSTSLTSSLNYSSALLLESSCDGTRQHEAHKAQGGPPDSNPTGDHTGDIGIICLPEKVTCNSKAVADCAWFRSGSEPVSSEAGGTNVETNECVKSGSSSAALHGSAVTALTCSSALSKSNLSVDNVSSEGAALMEFHRGAEVDEISVPDKNGRVSLTLKLCQQFPPLRIADASRASSLSAANAAVAAGLSRGSFVLSHTPAAATTTTTLVGNASLEESTGIAPRHNPFHILLTRLCGDAEAPLLNCAQRNFLQKHEDEIWQKQFTRHQRDSEKVTGKRAHNFPTTTPHAFVSDYAPLSQGQGGSTATDDDRAATSQELLAGQSQVAGARNACDLPGALLQQQSVGRALLTRLASLQVQEALLRYTVTLPRSPPHATTPSHMRTDGRQTLSLHAKVDDCAKKSEQGPSLSQQVPHGEWPMLASKEDRSTFTHTQLQQSELFSLMQNHTTCVFHFVIRAICLLANCCPIWAAAGNDVAQKSAAAKEPHNSVSPPTASGSRDLPPAATVTSYTSREDCSSVAAQAHDGDQPSAASYADENKVMSAGKAAEAVTSQQCKKCILPSNSQSRLPTAAGEDGSKSASLVEVTPGGLGGNAGISSYRWHWMHVVSFLTHPELLSVYHTTLAPLLSLFIQNAQSGSGKHCARIESLDTSSSHDDELSTAGENVTEKAPQLTSQRQNTGTINSSCCGAGSWLVVRQVLCDLDDLRFLHDPSFVPCPQRQDPSFCALQQQHTRMVSHSHHLCCGVLSQSSPLLCCSAPKCSDQCPGAFYCGAALLRSSVFFGSFLEASRALAVWPQYLAAAAAAALPLSTDSRRCNRSAFLTTYGDDGASLSTSVERRRHMRALFTKGSGTPTTVAPRAAGQWEQRADAGARVCVDTSSKTRADFTDAARGVAACILKHVDLNKLDSTELLALLKLTEEAGSPSPLSPCEEHHRAERETSTANRPGTLAATLSAVPDCNRVHTSVTPCTQSDRSGTPSPAEPISALKRSRSELTVDLQSHDQNHPLRSVCPTATEPCPFTGGESGETQPVVPGGDMACGHEVGDKILAAAVSTGADLASSAKHAGRCPDDSPASLLVADGKLALPEETRKALLRFSPLFSPRKQQHSMPRLPGFHLNNTSTKKMKAAAVAGPEARGQRQPVESTLASLNSAFCGLYCPAVSPENTGGLVCVADLDLSDFPQCNEKGTNLRDTVQDPDTGTRQTSLSLTVPAAMGETELLQLSNDGARCQRSTVSPLHGTFPDASFPATAVGTGNSSHKAIGYRSGCRRIEIPRSAVSAALEPIPETLENKQVSVSSVEHPVSNALETKFLSLAVAIAPTERAESEVGTFSGADRLTGDEGDFKAKKGECGSAVSALDIIEHERALSLVAAGVRNTRKRFRLQSVRRKADARLHYGVNCLALRTDESSWDNKTMARISLHNVSPKQQRLLDSPQSPRGLTSGITEASQNSSLCRLASTRVSNGVPAGRRRHATGTTSAASGSNNSFTSSSHVRSPVKGIYYDSYKKLWRVQWNSCSGVLQQPTTNLSVSSTGHGGAGRRVSRSFSCARLGFEAAKARAVAWMLSGGHVGDGGLTDALHRASPENQANSTTAGNAPPGATGAIRPLGKHEPEKSNSGPASEVHKAAERQEADEREQKEKLLFANPKLFLERVEAFYVRNGLYGLQCGNGAAGGPAERQRCENKDGEEQQHGAGSCSYAASQASSSRKGNGGTGGLRIVSVLSLDDMLDIVQGKKITMSLPYTALKQTPVESNGRAGKSEVGFAASYSRSCHEGQHLVSRQQEESATQSSRPCFRDPESHAESAKKKSRTREAAVPVECGGQRCVSKSSSEKKIDEEDTASFHTGDVIETLVRGTQESSPS